MSGRRTTITHARSTVALALAVLVGASGVLGVSSSAIARSEGGTRPQGTASWLSVVAGVASLLPLRSLAALTGASTIDDGSDGRLTVLLLGSDTRASGLGRTDTIMVVSLKGNTITAASIPRDTAKIPNPFTVDPIDTFTPRVNAILKSLRRTSGTNQLALERFEYVIEDLLQIEIDYYALITFEGFEALVDEVDPISIDIAKTIRDTRFWDDPKIQPGVYFPVATGYDLNGWPDGPLCNGLFRDYASPPPETWCHHALPFVRSRKGPGNSDFARARRQQDFVDATIDRVISRGIGPLGGLLSAAANQAADNALYTDVPLGMSSALELFGDLFPATLGNRVVSGPTTYSTHIPGTTAYRLNLTTVRTWAAANLK